MPLPWRASAPIAKLSVPQAAPGLLPRQRLVQRLQHAAAGVWVGAPPAAGKTVLAATSLRARGAPALWYQIDGDDADPLACFHFLAQAAAALLPRNAKLPRPGRETGPALDEFARAWFRALYAALPPGTVLVFDDWHRLPAAHPLAVVVPALIAELPPALRLWLLSREDPPPPLDGARLHGRLQVVGFAELALTVDETAALLQLQAGAGAAGRGERWHRWCDGWVGALVLALAAGRPDPDGPPAAPGTADMQPLYRVLAAEVLDRADAELREFMLVTAWAPFVSEALARQLAAAGDAAGAIAALVRRHLLTPLPLGREAGWRYHPLMREFLQARARQTWTADELSSRLQSYASRLDAAGWPEAAAELLIEAGAAPALAALLLRHAAALLAQGRYGTLAAWAAALPEAARSPQADYWWAGALLARDARLGQQRYERAWHGFWALGDADGLYRSWCGVIEATTFACDDYGVFDLWLQRLRELRRRFARYPSLTVRAQVAVYRFAASFFLHPRPPEFDGWLRTVQRLYRYAPRRGDRAAIGALLGLHYAAHGGMAALGAHLHGLRPLLDDPEVPPFQRLVGGVPDVIHHWIAGDTARALQRLAACEALAAASGAHAIDTQFAFQAAYVHLLRGDTAAAGAPLDRVAPRLADIGGIDGAQYGFLVGWRALLAGRIAEARQLLEDAVDDMRRRRFAFLEAIGRGLLGEVTALAGDSVQARRHADEALALARALGSVTAQVPCAMQRAAVAEIGGEAEDARRGRLAEALALARRHGHWGWGGLNRATLARLALRALEWGIEPGFATSLIQRYALSPPPGTALGAWPWPLRVRGFGGLQLSLGGEPLAAGATKAAQRPLDLVRALLAVSPRPLPVATALSWIWPDAETVDQRKAFDVALLRARRLLGDESLLRLDAGVLSFDAERVWTDTAALLALAERVPAAGDGAAAAAWAAEWLDLVRGPLLPDDEAPWVLAARERLRRRAAAAAERIVGLLEPTAAALAREVLQRAFDADPASEPLARGLAVSLAASGDRREAQRVLALCASTRALTGEPPLGAETQALAGRLQQ